MGTKDPILFPSFYVREKGGEKESTQVFFLRSSEFLRSEFVQKTWSFIEDPKEDIWGNQKFWAKKVFLRPPTTSITLQEVGILPTLVLFPPFRLILEGLLCRCSKGLFSLLKNSLWSFLWPICGRFCGPICECLWHVQKIVLGVVWIRKQIRIVKGLFGRFLWPV